MELHVVQMKVEFWSTFLLAAPELPSGHGSFRAGVQAVMASPCHGPSAAPLPNPTKGRNKRRAAPGATRLVRPAPAPVTHAHHVAPCSRPRARVRCAGRPSNLVAAAEPLPPTTHPIASGTGRVERCARTWTGTWGPFDPRLHARQPGGRGTCGGVHLTRRRTRGHVPVLSTAAAAQGRHPTQVAEGGRRPVRGKRAGRVAGA